MLELSSTCQLTCLIVGFKLIEITINTIASRLCEFICLMLTILLSTGEIPL